MLVGSLNGQAQTFTSNTGIQNWNSAGNWTPSGFPNAVGASTTFVNAGAATTVNLGAAITVGSINATQNSAFVRTIANGTNGSLTFDAVGSGEASIVFGGTSTTTNAFTLSSSTTLNDTLRFTNNNTSGAGAATATITGSLSGSGGFIKDGAGRFSFSTAAKTYTGATVVNQGRLRMTSSGQITGTSSITVNSGGSLYLDSGSGAWSLGSGVVTINGDGDNGGGTGTQGALRNQGSSTNTLSNAVALGSNATIHVDGSSTLQLNGGLTGSSTLTKSGGGTLQFTTTNSGLASNLLVQNGTILVNSASRIGSGSLTLAQTAGNNTVVTLNNSLQTVSSLSSSWVDTTGTQSQTITLNGTALTVDQATNGTFGNGAVSTLTSTIAGTGSLIKSGAASLTLTSANSYTGTTSVTAGTLNVQNTLATSGVTVSGGTLNLSGTGTLGAGTVTASGGTIDLGGKSITNTLGALTGGGAINNGTVTSTNGSYDVQNGSASAVLAGSNNLMKSTAGIVTLSGANTYSGETFVSAGTLDVTGSGSLASPTYTIDSGAILNSTGAINMSSGVSTVNGTLGGTGLLTVANGATLQGTGTIGNGTIVNGILNSGNSAGTLTFTSSLTLGGTSITNIEILDNVGGQFDVLSGNGSNTLTVGGVLALNNTGYAAMAGDSVTIFSNWSVITGTFSSITGTDLGGGLSWNTSNLYTTGLLTVTAVPEPTSMVLVGLVGVAGVAIRARRRLAKKA